MSILTLLLRLFIGLVLLATSVGKLLDVPGFAEVVRSYQLLPDNSGLFLAVSLLLSLGELALALCLLGNRFLALASLGALLLHGMFTVLAAGTLMRGLELDNCGCFGVFWQRPLTWGTVGEDVFMTICCAVLFFLARKQHA